MDNRIDDIYKIVSNKLVKTELTKEQVILYIQEVEQKIKNYCQRPEVPVALNYTWANMTVDLINYQLAVINGSSGAEGDLDYLLSGNFGTIAMGDTSWKQGKLDASDPRYKAISSHNADLDDIVLNYRQDLNQFRRIW